MSAIDELTKLVQPPDDTPAFDWAGCEDRLGTKLPSDYKQLVDIYGWGGFYLELAVWVPPCPGLPDYGNIEVQGPWARDALQRLVSDMPAGNEWMYPDGTRKPVEITESEASSFLGWGSADGDYGFWHMTGPDPDQWPAVFTDLGARWDYDPNGMVAYLVAKFSQTFPENTAPYDFDDPFFERWPAE